MAGFSKRVQLLIVSVLWLGGVLPSPAPPPLITGDVPTADKGTFEWYVGGLYQESASIERALPFTELVYGLTERWEITAETAYVSSVGEHGLSDTVFGTKYVFVHETEHRPGIAGSFEASVPTGDEDRGLGSGAPAYDLRARLQKTFGFFTGILNAGYVINEEPGIAGVREDRENVYRASFAQEWRVAKQTKLLSEIYGRTSDDPHGDYRVAAQIGFKHQVTDNLQLHGAVGRSLREHTQGGPDLRVYLGVRLNFDAPWTKRNP